MVKPGGRQRAIGGDILVGRDGSHWRDLAWRGPAEDRALREASETWLATGYIRLLSCRSFIGPVLPSGRSTVGAFGGCWFHFFRGGFRRRPRFWIWDVDGANSSMRFFARGSLLWIWIRMRGGMPGRMSPFWSRIVRSPGRLLRAGWTWCLRVIFSSICLLRLLCRELFCRRIGRCGLGGDWLLWDRISSICPGLIGIFLIIIWSLRSFLYPKCLWIVDLMCAFVGGVFCLIRCRLGGSIRFGFCGHTFPCRLFGDFLGSSFWLLRRRERLRICTGGPRVIRVLVYVFGRKSRQGRQRYVRGEWVGRRGFGFLRTLVVVRAGGTPAVRW